MGGIGYVFLSYIASFGRHRRQQTAGSPCTIDSLDPRDNVEDQFFVMRRHAEYIEKIIFALFRSTQDRCGHGHSHR